MKPGDTTSPPPPPPPPKLLAALLALADACPAVPPSDAVPPE